VVIEQGDEDEGAKESRELEEHVDKVLSAFGVSYVRAGEMEVGWTDSRFDAEAYGDDEELQWVGWYLEDPKMSKPEELDRRKWRRVRQRARLYQLEDRVLVTHIGFRRRRVRAVGDTGQRHAIIREFHEGREHGGIHQGVRATVTKIQQVYTWRGIYGDVMRWVRTCDRCQRVRSRAVEEPVETTPVEEILFRQWYCDHVVVANIRGKPGGVLMFREAISGFLVGEATTSKTSKRALQIFKDRIHFAFGPAARYGRGICPRASARRCGRARCPSAAPSPPTLTVSP
jgi:hypothetical protein